MTQFYHSNGIIIRISKTYIHQYKRDMVVIMRSYTLLTKFDRFERIFLLVLVSNDLNLRILGL